MDPNAIEPGKIYRVDYGSTFRVMVLRPAASVPGWWHCEELQTGALRMLPSSAFRQLEDDGSERK